MQPAGGRRGAPPPRRRKALGEGGAVVQQRGRRLPRARPTARASSTSPPQCGPGHLSRVGSSAAAATTDNDARRRTGRTGPPVKMLADDVPFAQKAARQRRDLDGDGAPSCAAAVEETRSSAIAVLLPCCGASVSNETCVRADRMFMPTSASGSGSACVLCKTTGVRIDEVCPNKQVREAEGEDHDQDAPSPDAPTPAWRRHRRKCSGGSRSAAAGTAAAAAAAAAAAPCALLPCSSYGTAVEHVRAKRTIISGDDDAPSSAIDDDDA